MYTPLPCRHVVWLKFAQIVLHAVTTTVSLYMQLPCLAQKTLSSCGHAPSLASTPSPTLLQSCSAWEVRAWYRCYT